MKQALILIGASLIPLGIPKASPIDKDFYYKCEQKSGYIEFYINGKGDFTVNKFDGISRPILDNFVITKQGYSHDQYSIFSNEDDQNLKTYNKFTIDTSKGVYQVETVFIDRSNNTLISANRSKIQCL